MATVTAGAPEAARCRAGENHPAPLPAPPGAEVRSDGEARGAARGRGAGRAHHLRLPRAPHPETRGG